MKSPRKSSKRTAIIDRSIERMTKKARRELALRLLNCGANKEKPR